jgi:ABC-type multidrug transport system ATPase subunit
VALDHERRLVKTVMQALALDKAACIPLDETTSRMLRESERRTRQYRHQARCRPLFIFLDGPALEIDAREALNVMAMLRRVASKGRIAVSAIRWLPGCIFQLIDEHLAYSEAIPCISV